MNALAAVDAEIVNKTIERNTAITVRDNTVASLRALLRGSGASSQIDDRVDPLLNAAQSWGNYSYAYEAAVANVSRATEARDTWADKVASYDAMLADSAGSLARLNADIATLDAQIAATSQRCINIHSAHQHALPNRALSTDISKYGLNNLPNRRDLAA